VPQRQEAARGIDEDRAGGARPKEVVETAGVLHQLLRIGRRRRAQRLGREAPQLPQQQHLQRDGDTIDARVVQHEPRHAVEEIGAELFEQHQQRDPERDADAGRPIAHKRRDAGDDVGVEQGKEEAGPTDGMHRCPRREHQSQDNVAQRALTVGPPHAPQSRNEDVGVEGVGASRPRQVPDSRRRSVSARDQPQHP